MANPARLSEEEQRHALVRTLAQDFDKPSPPANARQLTSAKHVEKRLTEQMKAGISAVALANMHMDIVRPRAFVGYAATALDATLRIDALTFVAHPASLSDSLAALSDVRELAARASTASLIEDAASRVHDLLREAWAPLGIVERITQARRDELEDKLTPRLGRKRARYIANAPTLQEAYRLADRALDRDDAIGDSTVSEKICQMARRYKREGRPRKDWAGSIAKACICTPKHVRDVLKKTNI